MTRNLIVLIALSFAFFATPVLGQGKALADGCGASGSAGTASVTVNGVCIKKGKHGRGPTGPPTRTYSCTSGADCGSGAGELRACTYTDAAGRPHLVAPFASQTFLNGKWSAPVLWCPADADPAATLAAIRDHAIRLLPNVRIGHAYSDGALVNAEEIFWVDTPTARPLPAVTIVGQRVELRISLASVHWDFGDDTADDPTNAGRPYDNDSDPCHTAECPDYYGHTYRHSGTVTVTTTIDWHASYRVNGGAWTDLEQPITGPRADEQLRIVEARAVLVPNAR